MARIQVYNPLSGKFDFVEDNTSTTLVYEALLSQPGILAPTPIIGENTLSGIPVWTRTSPGFFVCTLAGAFPLDKTYIWMSANANGGAQFYYDIQSLGAPNSFNLYIMDRATGVMSDGLLTYAPIFIKVRP